MADIGKTLLLLGVLGVGGFFAYKYFFKRSSPCDTSADCDPGKICSEGYCVPDVECTVNSECSEGRICSGNRCVCPSGTHWNGSSCITCPPGTTWNGTNCAIACPQGAVRVGADCVDYIDTLNKCTSPFVITSAESLAFHSWNCHLPDTFNRVSAPLYHWSAETHNGGIRVQSVGYRFCRPVTFSTISATFETYTPSTDCWYEGEKWVKGYYRRASDDSLVSFRNAVTGADSGVGMNKSSESEGYDIYHGTLQLVGGNGLSEPMTEIWFSNVCLGTLCGLGHCNASLCNTWKFNDVLIAWNGLQFAYADNCEVNAGGYGWMADDVNTDECFHGRYA